MYRLFLLSGWLKDFAYDQIIKRGDLDMIKKLLMAYYGPAFKAMGLEIDIVSLESKVSGEIAQSKEEMLKLLGEGDDH